ncbi:hypothetical protein [Thalassotalea sp. PS06]|uniref:hypothetical protein n=1 Tax=Thalassotalea sp. PS06 TaxID=2594005 RepID=UPI001162B37A|nr:hypothetical protein [Thalassotalea sp. PS06]QDP01999.1 hypothetical protein FNC98_12005 [Thalassotalea sp. PS06]
MEQDSFWQGAGSHPQFHQLCHALYEREVDKLSALETSSVAPIQAKLKSLSHYISRTAHALLASDAPIQVDCQNASWSAKQSTKIPINDQTPDTVASWFQTKTLSLGLVVPVYQQAQGIEFIFLDCIDKIDLEANTIRCNFSGRFQLTSSGIENKYGYQLLKPNRKVMLAACSGHRWVAGKKSNPRSLDLRELLLSSQINWKNFQKPLPPAEKF